MSTVPTTTSSATAATTTGYPCASTTRIHQRPAEADSVLAIGEHHDRLSVAFVSGFDFVGNKLVVFSATKYLWVELCDQHQVLFTFLFTPLFDYHNITTFHLFVNNFSFSRNSQKLSNTAHRNEIAPWRLLPPPRKSGCKLCPSSLPHHRSLTHTQWNSDKKSASTFQVRYRSQDDPLFHDDTATPFVLHEVDAPNANKGSSSSSKVKSTHDLAAELGIDASTVRANEGEAAMYGIYYDDTQYDYMQHMREIGTTGEAIFIDAQQAGSKQRKDKRKKQTLDQAIMTEVEPKSKAVHIPKELLPSETAVKRTYQDMQDIPDAIAGFQPDMDPRLREVLEALEDEAYVEDDEDIFAELAKGGEADEGDFFGRGFEDEEDGWQSDTTEKAAVRPSTAPSAAAEAAEAATAPVPIKGEPAAEGEGNADWMREFSKFKKAQKKEKAKKDEDSASSLADTMSFGGSSVVTAGTVSISGRRRRRREKKNGGAKTATSGYSMSSSALFRTEGLTLLDDRFDKVRYPPSPALPIANTPRSRRNTTTPTMRSQ